MLEFSESARQEQLKLNDAPSAVVFPRPKHAKEREERVREKVSGKT